MRLLVTGASGLLGLNLALEASHRHDVVGTINQHRLRTSAFEVLSVDLGSPGAIEQMLEYTRPDWVIHCAALANLEACEAAPELAYQLNTQVPGQLAMHVAKGGARLLHVSTDAVFDGTRGGYSEEDEPNPLSVYARTKLEGERAVLSANSEAIVARVNLFGWSLRGERSLSEWFFYNLQAKNPVKGFTDVYFCPLLANELGRLLVRMLEKQLTGLYHVVSRECISKYAFGVAIARQFGLQEELIAPISVSEFGLRAARSPLLTLKSVKLSRDLGEELPGISEGIQQLYSLYQAGYPQALRSMAVQGS